MTRGIIRHKFKMDSNFNHGKETDEDTEVSENHESLRTIIFDIVTPLLSLGIDLAKAGLLISTSLSVEGAFGEVAVYGVTALAIKWTPALVAALYLQEVCWEQK